MKQKPIFSENSQPNSFGLLKHGRPDAESTVAFLGTRVQAPDKDDWHDFKLLMMCCWVKKTKANVRIIGAYDLLNMIVMINSAHAVHNGMRGHTGGVTSFGTSIKTKNQKMNTLSSTKMEHFGTNKYFPKPVFFAQGYKPHTILAKDKNTSEIRMLVNGKASCTSNLKHVAMKYFGAQIVARN